MRITIVFFVRSSAQQRVIFVSFVIVLYVASSNFFEPIKRMYSAFVYVRARQYDVFVEVR